MDALSAIIGFVSGVVSNLVGGIALKEMLRPRLKLHFQAGSESCVTPTYSPDDAGNPGPKCHYISIRVDNAGRTTAKNCRGFLVRMERRDSNGKWVAFVDEVLQLCWAYSNQSENGTGYDLLPGMHRYLNVVWVDERSPTTFIPATITIPNRWHGKLTRDASVRFTVQVAAEEADSRLCILEFTWGGQWCEYSVERTNCEPLDF